jgi:hypothetical protein
MLTDALFSSTTLLWLVGSLIAFFLLTGSMSRRRLSLTELLRSYVRKNQREFTSAAPESTAKKKPKSSSQAPPDSSQDS